MALIMSPSGPMTTRLVLRIVLSASISSTYEAIRAQQASPQASPARYLKSPARQVRTIDKDQILMLKVEILYAQGSNDQEKHKTLVVASRHDD